jgi:hypothetical protein
MQEYLPTTIQLRSIAGKTLTYHEEKNVQTLVVNLPQEKFQICQENPSINKCASFKRPNTQTRAQKSDLTSVSCCVVFK